MKINEFNEPVRPDTYEASMALNQIMKIGKHAVKLHKLIDDSAEMEAWVAKKIDLAGDYVKSVHGYMQGEDSNLYDDGGLTESREQIGDYAREIKSGRIVRIVDYTDDDEGIYTISYGEDKGENDVTAKDLKFLDQTGRDQEEIGKFGEDAGEGHMSKSTLYHTAKYAIELASMVKPGDDLEGWVQSKLNKAADYLQGAYNYEEYQKLNPYREELDSNTLNKHAQVVQKHIDEILARETKLDDIDTKPGMMRILSKRVNEVEKELAKDTRKEVDEAPIEQDRDNPVAKPYVDTPEWKALHDMDDKIINAYIKHKEVKEVGGVGRAIGTAARSLGAKAAGKLGMKKTAAGLQGRVDVDKKSAELDTALAQYIGTQRADKNKIDPKILQGFLNQQGIDKKYMQYVKGPLNQQQAGKLLDKISADGMAGKVDRPQPNVPGAKDTDQAVQQRATQFKNVVGAKGTSPGMTAKGIGALAKGQRPQPNQLKQIAPYAAQLQKIMADPKLAQRFRQLLQMANRQQPVTADVNEMDLDEGLKDWAKKLAMAGVIVGAVAGAGSIENAIDNQVPAVKALNTAYELAVDQGHDDLAKMIKNDLSAVKVRLHSGKDLNFVKNIQDKYSKFVDAGGLPYSIDNEGLQYESKLAIMLNQRV